MLRPSRGDPASGSWSVISKERKIQYVQGPRKLTEGAKGLYKTFSDVSESHLEGYLLPSPVSQQPEESELRASTQKQILTVYDLGWILMMLSTRLRQTSHYFSCKRAHFACLCALRTLEIEGLGRAHFPRCKIILMPIEASLCEPLAMCFCTVLGTGQKADGIF